MTSPGVAAFHVDSSVDGSLMDIVERILPMCQNFIRLEEVVDAFVSVALRGKAGSPPEEKSLLLY